MYLLLGVRFYHNQLFKPSNKLLRGVVAVARQLYLLQNWRMSRMEMRVQHVLFPNGRWFPWLS